MAKPYKITITNGIGAGSISNGDYTVTANVNGYSHATLTPSSINVNSSTTTFQFTISATGSLTLHITEEGTSEGTAVVGAKFIRCDKAGATYGSEIISDTNGDIVFNNVPFDEINAPLIYYKQTESDGNHDFDNTLKTTSLDINTKTIEIQNSLPLMKTFTVTDLNYSNLPIEVGEINLV